MAFFDPTICALNENHENTKEPYHINTPTHVCVCALCIEASELQEQCGWQIHGKHFIVAPSEWRVAKRQGKAFSMPYRSSVVIRH